MKIKSFALVFFTLVLAAAIYGFAAANTVPDTGAGDGSGTICGYTISNIDYTLNGADPSVMDTVSFDTAPAGGCTGVGDPTTVEVQVQTGGTWYSCSTPGATLEWDCSLAPGEDVSTADQLRVIAVE